MNNQKLIFPIKTKIAAQLMRIFGFLSFGFLLLMVISGFRDRMYSTFHFILASIFLLISLFLFIFFPTFLLNKKRWGWWGSVGVLSFFTIFIFYSFISHAFEYGLWGDVFTGVTNTFLPFYVLVLILFLVDRKRYWKISSPVEIKVTPKIKILIGILITVILIGGGWIWDSYHPQGEVTIFIDKTNYETGEIAKITVKNNLNKTIWYTDCHFSPWWGLRKLEEGEWNPISVYLPSEPGKIIILSPYCSVEKLKPNSEISYSWDFKTETTNDTEFVEPGIYKFSFSYGYGFDKDFLHYKTIYSNEFTIKQKEEAETKEEVKISDISDWEIYSNEEYGFEIKYPRDWDAWDDTQRNCFPQHPCIFSFDIHSPVVATGWIRVGIFNNPDALSVKDWLYKFKKIEELEGLEGFSLKEIEIADKRGLRLTYLPPHPGQVTWQNDVYISEGNFIYNISLPGLLNPPDIQGIIDQMLSTFKFIE